MNWRFCPHCETQLDEATGICPACRWDPLESPAPVPAAPEQSLMERYRGTEYDSQAAVAANVMVQRRRASGPTAKAKMILLSGVLILFALYGGMWAWVQIRDSQPPAPVTISVP